jgi:hypothetical protein
MDGAAVMRGFSTCVHPAVEFDVTMAARQIVVRHEWAGPVPDFQRRNGTMVMGVDGSLGPRFSVCIMRTV